MAAFIDHSNNQEQCPGAETMVDHLQDATLNTLRIEGKQIQASQSPDG